MAIEFSDLRVFLAIVETGSFSRAANALVLAQPSVSERVVRLERTVGVALFERTARGARISPAGERLLPYARRCVGLADDALDALRTDTTVPRLRIAVHTTFAHRAVPLVLHALGASRRRVSVHDAHSHEVQAMLLDDAADVGFVLPAAVPRGLEQVALRADPVVCVVARDHPLSGRRRVTVADLATSPVAVNVWGDQAETFVQLLAKAGLPEPDLRRLSDANTAAVLARDLAHVAAVTESTVRRELGRGELARLPVVDLPRWRVPLALTYRRRDAADPVVVAVRRAARREGAA